MEQDPIQILATVAVLALVVKGIVDAVRRQYPALDGLAVQALAVFVGALIAFALDVRATEALLESVGAVSGRIPPPALDYIVTGAAMAATAGFFAELAGRSGGDVGTIIEIDENGKPVL